MLTPLEGRILGCLLEKERTTPEQYPLSLNALTLACNQSTARDPVMTIDPSDVQSAIASLKGTSLVRLVHPSHGRSVTRFRQVADEHFGWSMACSAVMSTLLLRGPQTTSEIRTRSERLYQFSSFEELDTVLAELADMHECSESEIVRTLLFIHLYGLADFEAMRLQQQGWFMPRPPKRGSVGRDIGIKYSRTLNSFPELGKNIHAFRLWFPDVMKQDLQKLAAKDGKLLSPYVRVLLIRQLLGEAYQHDAGEWVAPQGSEEAEKE